MSFDARSARPRAFGILTLTALGSLFLVIACADTSAGSSDLGQTKQAIGCATDEQCPATTPVCNAGACIADTCGNGKTYGGTEQCDDGNTTDGDGCSATCVVEKGYVCHGQPNVCTTTCGDGVQAPGEDCDDGNTTAGDGCSTTCRIESGFSCANPQVSVFYTRNTLDNCYAVPSLEPSTPPAGIPAAYAVSNLKVWKSYRVRHAAGAADFGDAPTSWRSPTVLEWNDGNATKTAMFGGLVAPGQTTRAGAQVVAQSVSLDFALGDANSVRGTVPDTFCPNDSNDTITYRIDSMSACTPICVAPALPAGGTCTACLTDDGTPGTAPCFGATPFCGTDGACTKCSTNAECTGHPGGPTCNTATGACTTKCQVDTDCGSASKWCDNPTGQPGAGTCTNKLPNGTKLPTACSPATGTRICASGACEPSDNTCGLLDGKDCGSASAADDCRTKCTSGVCGECGKQEDCKDPKKPFCQKDKGMCRACTAATEASDCKDAKKSHCVIEASDTLVGTCAECTSNAQCPASEPVCGAATPHVCGHYSLGGNPNDAGSTTPAVTSQPGALEGGGVACSSAARGTGGLSVASGLLLAMGALLVRRRRA